MCLHMSAHMGMSGCVCTHGVSVCMCVHVCIFARGNAVCACACACAWTTWLSPRDWQDLGSQHLHNPLWAGDRGPGGAGGALGAPRPEL